MAADTRYRFCFLSKKIEDGISTMRSWIPEKFAIPGNYLELLNNGKWDNGWHVESASSNTQIDKFINKRPAFGSLDDNARSRKIGVGANV